MTFNRRSFRNKGSTHVPPHPVSSPTHQADPGADEKGKRAARTFTAEQRRVVALAHRTHALCLLARCVMHDVAASDAGLQVTGRERHFRPSAGLLLCIYLHPVC
jgi:hypothetical protein